MKKKKLILILAACAVIVALGITVMAYDSSADPIISLSYLTDVFKPQIMREVDAKVEEAGASQSGTASSEESSQYEIVELTLGDELFAKDACDIMLRSGKASCVAPDPKQGIADYTDATEILNGQPLTKNHMCLIPRGDGRGVVAESESVFIMVRGAYIVVKH